MLWLNLPIVNFREFDRQYIGKQARERDKGRSGQFLAAGVSSRLTRP